MTDAADIPATLSDRRLAARLAPAPVRPQLEALLAWMEEIEDIPAKAKEPAILAMRFAWHREAVSDLFASPRKVRRHDAYEGLADLLESGAGISAGDLSGLIDAVEAALDPGTIADRAALAAHIRQHDGQLTRLSARLCGEAGGYPVEMAGLASGYARWLRGFAFRAGRKFALMPQTDLDAQDFNIHRLASGREPALAKAALAGVMEDFAAALSALREAGKCPAALYPALAPARLARATLKALRQADDLYRTDFSRSPLTRQLDLLTGSLTGRL